MTSLKVKAIPDGMHSITPYIICEDASEAITFYKNAFNAKEVMRLPGPDGKIMHACVQIGDSQLMLTTFPHLSGFEQVTGGDGS